MASQIAYVAFFLAPAALVAFYYFGLMVARMLGASAERPVGTTCKHRFVIVIPAHNEEDIIKETLASCQQIDYPQSKFDIYVLADNCADRTADIARSCDVACLERQSPDDPGKGQALAWAFPQVLSSTSCDAIVVIDADCVIDRHALHVFDQCISNGNQVLQANYVLSNPDAGPMSYLACIGNVTEYDLFYAPKSDLGLSVTLVGTGMVIHRSVLDRCPWQATSVTEDVEYTLTLTKARIPVHFVSNVEVRQSAAERFDQLRPQRARWARGTLGLGRRQSFGLMSEGIRNGNLRLMDLGWTLAVLSRPLILAHLFVTVILGGLLRLFAESSASSALMGVSLAILFLQVSYFAIGIVRIGITRHRLRLLLAAPAVGLKLLRISAAAVIRSDEAKWDRTPR